ncbi:MAG: ABC transporter substrate-binding protein [Deltaproteobacteria bacterium]|nr:ABC transporter substrate-binding protein [Deltaproteobacteria bacterium]MBW2121352.1 ABC transporter substrate-binding protein [Deltaproteobacteria bacterium]
MKRLFVISGFVLGLALCLVVFPVSSSPAKEPVQIGVILSLTGPIGPHGQEALNATELAVEEINRAGGVLGRPIKLLVEDGESRPKAGVEAAHKLADVNRVPVILGGWSSGLAYPEAEYLNSVKVVFVTDATTLKLRDIGPYVFDVADLADQAVALVDFAWADIGARRFATLSQNNPIGQDRAAVTKKRVEELGGTFVERMLYTVGAKDFRSDLMRLMAAKPDAILCDIYTGDAIIIQRQLYEMGVKDFSKFYQYNLGAMLGVPDKKLIEGMKGASYTTAGPRAADYKKKYREKFGKDFNDAWTPPFYDAAWIVAMAINMANSLDSKAIRDAMWPAAYVFQGVSAGGDKGFNRWGMQALDVTQKLVIHDGKALPYIEKGGTTDMLPFRYAGEDGITLQFAPSEEEFMKLYPNYKP